MSGIKICTNCPTVVICSATWCGHCVRAQPEFTKLKLAGDVKYHVKHFDADADAATVKLFRVQGYPTILAYSPRHKSFVKHEGERTATAIAKFALGLEHQERVDAWATDVVVA